MKNSMTEGSIWKALLSLFFPLWLGSFFQQLYNTVDSVVVGRLVGYGALAAVGCTGPVVSLLLGLFNGLASGAVVVIAQRFGAGLQDKIHRAVHTSMLLSLLAGAILTVVGIAGARPMLELMDTTEDTIADATLYLRIYFAGMIPNAVYNMGTGVLRAIGDSKRPLYFLIAASICNIVLDLLFVAVFRMGVMGVALATILSQLLSAVLVVACLMRARGTSYQLEPKKLRLYRPALRSIVAVGVPSAIQAVLYSVSNIVIQSAINDFETDTVAAWTAYGKVDVIFWMTLSAMALSLTTFAGQNFGAGNARRLRQGVRQALLMTAGGTVVLSAIITLLARPILSIFITDAAVLEIGVGMLRFLAPTYITYILVEILAGTLRSAGKSLGPTLITLFGVCVLRLGWILFAAPAFQSVYAVIVSYPVTWTITSVAMVVYYFKSNWLPIDAQPQRC